MTVFFCVTSVYSLVCFVLKLHRKMSVTFSDRSFHFCTYSVYYCSTKMFSFELTPFACPFSEFTSPVKAHSASSKKGLASFLPVSWTIRHSSCSCDAVKQRVGWTKNPSNTTRFSKKERKKRQIWGGNAHVGNKSSASQPNGNPSRPIEMY